MSHFEPTRNSALKLTLVSFYANNYIKYKYLGSYFLYDVVNNKIKVTNFGEKTFTN